MTGARNPSTAEPAAATRIATFAGGCFWCTHSAFAKLDGVTEVLSGYTGGHAEDPTYEQVCTGKTGHAEAIQVHFDPERIGYRQLLEVFWRQIDPTDDGGQFADRGDQYRTAIFVHDDEQRVAAEQSRAEIAASGRFDRPITTEIVAATTFYPAEPYHQDYYRKQPIRYQRYHHGSGRAAYQARVWGETEVEPVRPASCAVPAPAVTRDAELRRRLSPLQYRVTREEATEPPFDNPYWNYHEDGIYVDLVSGEPLFCSIDKYDSGSGWPSFIRPLESANITQREDRRLGVARTEVRSRRGDSHLGHVFPDGPPPTGLRYCINSAALRFVPRKDLVAAGYGQYARLFEPGGDE